MPSYSVYRHMAAGPDHHNTHATNMNKTATKDENSDICSTMHGQVNKYNAVTKNAKRPEQPASWPAPDQRIPIYARTAESSHAYDCRSQRPHQTPNVRPESKPTHASYSVCSQEITKKLARITTPWLCLDCMHANVDGQRRYANNSTVCCR